MGRTRRTTSLKALKDSACQPYKDHALRYGLGFGFAWLMASSSASYQNETLLGRIRGLILYLRPESQRHPTNPTPCRPALLPTPYSFCWAKNPEAIGAKSWLPHDKVQAQAVLGLLVLLQVHTSTGRTGAGLAIPRWFKDT